MNCDIILHFYWVHSSHIHKYLSFNKKLNEKCNSFLILDNGPVGTTSEQLSLFKSDDLKNVKLMSIKSAMSEFRVSKYKVYVFGSAGTKGARPWVELSINRGALIVELSDFMCDIYYKTPDILSLISLLMAELLPFKHDKIIYSNCLLWDNIEDCLPYFLSKKDFCDKYSLNEKEDIFLWTPDNIQSFKTKESMKVYDCVCGLKNVLVKIHPNEYKKTKQHFFGGKMSYDVFTKHKTRVLNPIDTHFAYKYADCGIGYSSSVGLEFPIYRKPYVYIGVDSKENILFNCCQKKLYRGKFSWVGGQCRFDEIESYFYGKKFQVKDNTLYDNHLKKFLADPSRSASDILTEQLLGFL